jgi:hypothetical protein
MPFLPDVCKAGFGWVCALSLDWPAVPRLALHSGKVLFFASISGVQVMLAKNDTLAIQICRTDFIVGLHVHQLKGPLILQVECWVSWCLGARHRFGCSSTFGAGRSAYDYDVFEGGFVSQPKLPMKLLNFEQLILIVVQAELIGSWAPTIMGLEVM